MDSSILGTRSPLVWQKSRSRGGHLHVTAWPIDGTSKADWAVLRLGTSQGPPACACAVVHLQVCLDAQDVAGVTLMLLDIELHSSHTVYAGLCNCLCSSYRQGEPPDAQVIADYRTLLAYTVNKTQSNIWSVHTAALTLSTGATFIWR